jgi:hypothetical protein
MSAKDRPLSGSVTQKTQDFDNLLLLHAHCHFERHVDRYL